MIPKTIHYCWFGRGEKPKLVKKCIETWQKNLPEYKLIEWNEENFDVRVNTFVRQAYENKHYAFVSDFARAFVLYKYGGIYLDTDVEVLKSFDKFLENKMFAGFEEADFVGSCVVGAEQGAALLKEYMNHYENTPYVLEDGSKYKSTNVVLLTNLCEQRGIKRNNKFQNLEDIVIFPRTVFSPYDYINGANYITEESYAIHHFAQLWLPRRIRIKSKIKRIVINVIGAERMASIREKMK